MRFPAPLVPARLLRRYKRFLSDIVLADGTQAVAHCANPGSMLGLATPGARIWLAANRNPKAKLPWRWELVECAGTPVGVNTGHANAIVAEALAAGAIPALSGYATLRREIPCGSSRIDFLLEDLGRPPCFVEVKSVTLRRDLPGRAGAAEFPDAVTARGTRHLAELAARAAGGARAVMLYLVQRGDCDHFRLAGDIDPGYATALATASAAGVEAICYACRVTPQAIEVDRPLPVVLECDRRGG